MSTEKTSLEMAHSTRFEQISPALNKLYGSINKCGLRQPFLGLK